MSNKYVVLSDISVLVSYFGGYKILGLEWRTTRDTTLAGLMACLEISDMRETVSQSQNALAYCTKTL